MNYLIEDKEKFLAMRQAWKDHVNNKGKVNPVDHIIYNALRGYNLDRGFQTVLKSARLAAGHRTAYSLALDKIKWQGEKLKYSRYGNVKKYPFFKFGLEDKEIIELCTHISL